MKEFQKGYTTPEQSKCLLNIGVPADSADCILFDESEDAFYFKKYHLMVIELPAYEFHRQPMISGRPGYLPCLSVGRLQEIAKICAKEKEYYYASVDIVAHQEDFVEWWVKHFTLTDNVLFDFSRLEK